MMRSLLSSYKLYSLMLICLLPALGFADAVLPADMLNLTGRFIETPPPVAPVRPVAEFEPASHVLIRYPLGIPVSLVAQLANTAQVVCIVASTSVQNQATTTFSNGGVNMANVSFLIAATDSYWTRDYGPWFIFDGNDEYGVVDFRYNRPRPNDDNIPEIFANQNGFNLYGMNLYQTGGNYMSDGIDTAAQTTIAYTENSSLTQAEINSRMLSYMGISNYQVLPDPNNTYIDHIDCWGKFLAPDKVLIRSVPTSHAQYNAIEQTATYFANLNCAWGYPYRVYRVNTPQNQPYTNSLILNRKVFVPIMNGSYDAAALQAYQTALPGYEVIGVAGTASAPWESTDALHCRTHEIPDQDMLYISHMPYWGTQTAGQGFNFNATVKPYSGMPVYSDSVFVCYKVNQGAWQTALLTNISGYEYTSLLTGFAAGDTIRYFIHAADQSGRSANHPYPAALDPHVFVIAGDAQAPVIVHEPLTQITNQSTLFTATVTDNVQVSEVSLRYLIDGGAVTELQMSPFPEAGDNVWSCILDPGFAAGDSVFSYQFEAADTATPANVAYFPANQSWINIPISGVGNADDVTGLSDISLQAVFPNPWSVSRSSCLTMEYCAGSNLPLVLKIFNIKGQLISEQKASTSSTDGHKYLKADLSSLKENLVPGVYLLKLDINGKSLSGKFLVID